jgi:hypothetical protein
MIFYLRHHLISLVFQGNSAGNQQMEKKVLIRAEGREPAE